MTGLAFNNPKIQRLRRLIGRRSARHEERCFVVEGPVLAAEAVAAGWSCRAQYVPAGADLAVDGAGEVVELAEGVFDRVAATETPRPPIVEVAMPADVGGALQAASLVVVLDRVADPGNVGTVLRSAEAAGVDLVVLTPGSADPYSPKTLRASAGALFHVPVVAATLEDVRAAGLCTVGTSSHTVAGRTVEPHSSFAWPDRAAIVMGNEAAGLPDGWTDDDGPIDRWVTIEQRGRSESLNVAMAATLLVFEAARGRSR